MNQDGRAPKSERVTSWGSSPRLVAQDLQLKWVVSSMPCISVLFLHVTWALC